MKKKFYITPTTVEIEVDSQNIFAGSQVIVGGPTDSFDSRKNNSLGWDNIWSENS
ncbi:MAG: hypothetical protein J6V00_02455 [Bacteroidaceae bacterium]|nr:hypothetical protein [Bacteroidaceae bacterium]